MNFTLCCLQEETEADREIGIKAVQAFGLGGSGFSLPIVFLGTLFLPEEWRGLMRLVGIFSLRIPHSSVTGTFLKVMQF